MCQPTTDSVADRAFDLDGGVMPERPLHAPRSVAPRVRPPSSSWYLAKSFTPPSSPEAFKLLFPAIARVQRAPAGPARRVERFALQSVGRTILRGVAREELPVELQATAYRRTNRKPQRKVQCLRAPTNKAVGVHVTWSVAAKRAAYNGLQTCGSVWCCPVCAVKVSEKRKAELVEAVQKHKSSGGEVYLVTRTVPHSAYTDLPDLLTKLRVAEAKYRAGAPWARVRDRFAIIGYVRALETTYGTNAWHPHVHELLFVTRELLPLELLELRNALFDRWSSAAHRARLPAPTYEAGVDVSGGERGAQYVAKWGVEPELTKGFEKHGKTSVAPFDLLRIALLDEDEAAVGVARGLFSEYALAFHGRRQLVWSHGLKDRFGILEKSDEELADEHDPDSAALASLTTDQWRHIVRAGMRGLLLEAVNSTDGQWTSVVQAIVDTAEGYAGPEQVVLPSGESRSVRRRKRSALKS